MATEIIMPKVAMGQTEGQLVEWLVRDGKWVDQGDPLMIIETEKVTQECESIGSGYVLPSPGPGEIVPCGTVIGWLAESEQELAELKANPPQTGELVVDEPEKEDEPVAAAPPAQSAPPAPVTPAPVAKPDRIKISPVAKRKAKANNLDYSSLSGSGPGGRILMCDIDAALARPAPISPQPAVWSGETVAGIRVKATLPVQGMRKAIAEHVAYSHVTAAELTIASEIDMSAAVQLREKFLHKQGEIGVRITYNDIFLLCLAKAVKYFPIVNSALIDNQIKIWEDINVAVAVALDLGPYELGLITPVVKNADQKSLTEISQITRVLAQKAKDGNLSADDTTGGTITLSNIGAYAPGWTITTPIINQPQAMIVQPGAIVDKVVAIEGQAVIRPILSLCLTFDHRIMDGVPPLKFLAKFKELVENPEYLLL